MAFTNLFTNGFRTIDGTFLNKLFNGQVTIPQMLVQVFSGNPTFTGNVTVNGNNVQAAGGFDTVGPQLLTAAGATQGNAAAVTSSKAIVTVSTTASTHGVRLPIAATGLEVLIANLGTFGVKVYPATNGKIGAASTNSADSTVLAINKANRYLALNTTLWAVQRGA